MSKSGKIFVGIGAIISICMTSPVYPLTIQSIDGQYSSTDMTFHLEFASMISPPSSAALDSVGGYIDLDIDRDPGTGDRSFVELFGGQPRVKLGEEFYIDLFSEAVLPGQVTVYEAISGHLAGIIPITYGVSSLEVRVPFDLMGIGPSAVNYGVLIGDFTGPTDRRPNGPDPLLTAPEGSRPLEFTVPGIPTNKLSLSQSNPPVLTFELHETNGTLRTGHTLIPTLKGCGAILSVQIVGSQVVVQATNGTYVSRDGFIYQKLP